MSAKEPDIRPEFSRLIQDIKDGIADGIISYHPDRLSRNMKEAGEIIEMVDLEQIQDLHFKTYQFEK